MNNSQQTVKMVETKRPKIETPGQAAVNVPPNGCSSTTLLDLYVDCFEELFEFLPIPELLRLRQTCKRLKAVVDHYFKEYYTAVRIGSGKIELDPANIDEYKKFNAIEVKMIKHVVIQTAKFRDEATTELLKIENVRQILSQIETIEFDKMDHYEENFYDRFLQFCPNLKQISISEIDIDRNCGSEWDFKWLTQHYPKLERIDLNVFEAGCPMARYDVHEFKRFFELNMNLKVFTVDTRVVVESRSYLNDFSTDQLNLKVETSQYLPEIYRITDEAEYFYNRGCYKRLHIYGFKLHQEAIDEILTLTALEKLYFGTGTVGKIQINHPHLNLKELAFGENVQFEDPETAAGNLPNVERIHFKRTEIQNILSFINHFGKVNKIRIDEVLPGTHFKNGVIDVAALNAEREQRERTSKVTVYVDEKVFLATKWSKKPTECPLVHLKKHSAYEWEHVDIVMPQRFDDEDEDFN